MPKDNDGTVTGLCWAPGMPLGLGGPYRNCRGPWHTGNVCQQSPVAAQSAEALRATCPVVLIQMPRRQCARRAPLPVHCTLTHSAPWSPDWGNPKSQLGPSSSVRGRWVPLAWACLP